MKNLFIALVFWQLAWWLAAPQSAGFGIARFCATLASALFVDCACNLFRYRRFVCSVSAAVTAGVVCVLSPESSVPLTAGAASIALVAGKHLAGGTGKNALNPAMLALAAIWAITAWTAAFGLASRGLSMGLGVPGIASYLASAPQSLSIDASLALTLALAFTIPGARFRPFAALGFAVGFILMGLWFRVPFIPSLLTALFWACVVMTDPVTITRRPAMGGALGLSSGMSFAAFGLGPFGGIVGVILALGVNALSFAADRLLPFAGGEGSLRLRKAVRFTGVSGDIPCVVTSDAALAALSPERILSIIKDANIEGRGGAGFPSFDKIETVIAAKAERKTLIVNAVECDPGLVHDSWLLSAQGHEISRGVSIVMKVCGIDEAIVAAKKTSAIPCEFPRGVRILRVPDRYPVGAERLLIRRATGVSLPNGAIPAREGFLVLNVQTVWAINAAVAAALAGPVAGIHPIVAASRPIGKFITVADLTKKKAKAAYVMPGTPIAEIIDREFPGTDPVFAGGGLMQAYRVGDGDVVGPDCNFVARAKSPRYKESPQCSRCSRCSVVCPSGLDVRAISDLVDSGNIERARALGAERCLSCGSCSAVCLAGKNLSYRVGLAKARNV